MQMLRFTLAFRAQPEHLLFVFRFSGFHLIPHLRDARPQLANFGIGVRHGALDFFLLLDLSLFKLFTKRHNSVLQKLDFQFEFECFFHMKRRHYKNAKRKRDSAQPL